MQWRNIQLRIIKDAGKRKWSSNAKNNYVNNIKWEQTIRTGISDAKFWILAIYSENPNCSLLAEASFPCILLEKETSAMDRKWLWFNRRLQSWTALFKRILLALFADCNLSPLRLAHLFRLIPLSFIEPTLSKRSRATNTRHGSVAKPPEHAQYSHLRSMAEVSFLPSANTRKRASASREPKLILDGTIMQWCWKVQK